MSINQLFTIFKNPIGWAQKRVIFLFQLLNTGFELLHLNLQALPENDDWLDKLDFLDLFVVSWTRGKI